MSVFTADDCTALIQQMGYVVGTGVAVIPDLASAQGFVLACNLTRKVLLICKKVKVTRI